MLRIRSVGKVDENALPVFERRDPHERADGLDVATSLADEAAHVAVRELDLDRHGPASAFVRLDDDFFRLLSKRLRHVFDERLVVHTGTRRALWTVTPETPAVEPASAAAKITPWQPHGFAFAVDRTELLRELLHRVAGFEHPVDVSGLHPTASRDALLARAVDDLWVRALALRHRQDDRLHLLDFFSRVLAGELPLERSAARHHIEHALERAHAAHLSHLGETVVERHLAGAKALLDFDRLVLVDRALGSFDQGQHVAHAQDARRHALGMKHLEVLGFLSGPSETNALAGRHAQRERGAASRVAIQLGEDHPVESDLSAEGLPPLHRLLAGHRVRDEERFGHGDGSLQLLELLHHLGVHMKASPGVQDQYVKQQALGLLHRGARDRLHFALPRTQTNLLP